MVKQQDIGRCPSLKSSQLFSLPLIEDTKAAAVVTKGPPEEGQKATGVGLKRDSTKREIPHAC
eukprot:3324452-Amphidinium_carterae.1